jgi:hypothetical protein
MRLLLRWKLFLDALELFFNPLDLLSCRGPLLRIQLRCFRAGQPPMRPVHNGSDHLQIADQLGAGAGRRHLLLGLTLRFEKQRRILQDPFADRGRSSPPSRIELARFARIAVMLGQDGGHALAVLQALAGCRHQKLHRHLRRDLAFADLLLDRFRQ